jgi:transcription elongation factor Elf1
LSWLDVKYINLLSGRLLRFKRKSPVLFNFRCVLCNDSEKSKSKARGYLYQRSGAFWFTCHNCGVSLGFNRFLKQVDTGLYNQYLLESLENKRPPEEINEPQTKKKLDNEALKELRSIRQLSSKHLAKKYVISRQIPEEFYDQLYYCEDFKGWTNQQIPDKFEISLEEERLVIPFLDSSGKMFGYQGRSFISNAKLRYISIMLDESKPKLYGLDRVDLNRKFYCIEGPIDSMFVKNAISSGGGKITSEIIKLDCDLDNAIVIYDNEPRNKEVVGSVRKSVYNNFSTVIWPQNLLYKDINEMILGGLSQDDVLDLLKKRTFKGLEAQLELQKWQKL